MNPDYEKQKRTFDDLVNTMKIVEDTVLAREGLKKIFMVAFLSAMSVAFSMFIGLYWELKSPLLLIPPTMFFNFSLYFMYDFLVQKHDIPVHADITNKFLKNNPNFKTEMKSREDGTNDNA